MSNTNEKKPYNPITINKEAQEQKWPTKSAEDKLYMILYYNPDTEHNEYESFVGRSECYRGIARVIEGLQIDPKDITVLVEYSVVNKVNKEYEWALMHPDAAKTGYDFCKMAEIYFPDDLRIDLSNYTDDREGEEPEEIDLTPTENKVDPQVFEGDVNLANDYMSMMQDKDKLDPKDLFAVSEENKQQDLFTQKSNENPFV